MTSPVADPRPAPVRALLRRLRHLPDRALHARRRTRLGARLADGERVQRVVILCHGNICRSPFAEAVLRGTLDGRPIEVVSGGFLPAGRESPAAAVAAAARRGIALAAHRSRAVHTIPWRRGDLWVVMDPGQRRRAIFDFGVPAADVVLLGDFDPAPIETRAIPDPIERPDAVYDAAYARIERCVGALATMLAAAERT